MRRIWPPVQAFRALTGWLRRAQKQGRLAKCDVETLAGMILGALHNWKLPRGSAANRLHPPPVSVMWSASSELLWNGIGGDRP